MSDLPTAESSSPETVLTTAPPPPTPLRCILGSGVAGGLAFLIWQLTQSIALSFARTPIVSDNRIVVRMSTAIRTLVVGMSAMGAGIWQQPHTNRPPLEVQMRALRQSFPRLDSVSHFAYSWQEQIGRAHV